MHFSLLIQTRLTFHWRKQNYGWSILIISYKHAFRLKKKESKKKLIDGLKLWGLFVDYCDVFISCLDSHSDGTHSLKRIHSPMIKADKNNTIMYVMLFFFQICPNEETISSTSWMVFIF